MKTLIITNFPEVKDLPMFSKRFADELKREDVIFIANPENKSELEARLESYQGEFDRVVVSAHGGKGEIPTMGIVGEDYLTITDVIETVNKGNEETLKTIHLTSCLIGSHFEKIEQKDVLGHYYSELDRSLWDGQILCLHGDTYTGDIWASLDQRLKEIVKNKDYSVSEAVFDSAEAMSVVIKKHYNLGESASLKTFSYQPFGREGEEFSTAALRPYLNDVVKKARDFEKVQGILNEDVSEQRLENLSEEDLQRYLAKSFIRGITKAIDGNHLKMAESLIKTADPNLANEEGRTALMIAANKGYTDITKLLLANTKTDPNLANEEGWTALMIAANKGHTDITKLLLANTETNPNLVNKDGWTALMLAADKGHTNIAELLLKNTKTDPNLVNKDGFTALMLAAYKGHADIAELLLKNTKTDPNLANKDGWTALMFAEDKGHTNIAELLLKNTKTDPNLVNKDGFTALMLAAYKGHTDITKLLLKNTKTDPNLANKDGWTALMIAADKGHTNIAELLFENTETDPNLVTKDGLTALMIAANKGHTKMVEYLIEKGADPEIKTPGGHTASSFSKGDNKDKIIELLSRAIERKQQDAILKEPENVLSSKELKEMRSEPGNSATDFLGRKIDEVGVGGNLEISWDGNKKDSDSRKSQTTDSVNSDLKKGGQDSNLLNPRLRGSKTFSPSTTIENGTATLFLVVGAAIAKFVAGKFKPTKTPKPTNSEKVENNNNKEL